MKPGQLKNCKEKQSEEYEYALEFRFGLKVCTRRKVKVGLHWTAELGKALTHVDGIYFFFFHRNDNSPLAAVWPGKTARSPLVQQDKPISILIQMLQTSVNQNPSQMASQCRWQWRWACDGYGGKFRIRRFVVLLMLMPLLRLDI